MLKIVKQDKCPKYSGSSIFLCLAKYTVGLECSSLVLFILGFSGVMVRALVPGAVDPGFQWCNG